MHKGKILVVDDEPLILTFFRRLFEGIGYDVKTAQDGPEALALVGKETFDIVYTDLVMPEMNGAELCKQIKGIAPRTIVILLSGHPGHISKYVLDFLKAGGRDEILRKPVTEEEILKTTAKVMQEIEKGGGHAN